MKEDGKMHENTANTVGTRFHRVRDLSTPPNQGGTFLGD